MKDGPDISHVAALIGDPARSNMLLSLMDGGALTASELADAAGVTKQTASSHLSRLMDGGLLEKEVQGRHRYFRIRDKDVAAAIEALLTVAQRGAGKRVRTGPKDPELRRARVCYDHLAGELGVLMFDRMSERVWLEAQDGVLSVTEAGRAGLAKIGVDAAAQTTSRRPLCKTCLDWSMRRHHLAGRLGADIFERIGAMGWARRRPDSRIVQFTPEGEARFKAWLG